MNKKNQDKRKTRNYLKYNDVKLIQTNYFMLNKFARSMIKSSNGVRKIRKKLCTEIKNTKIKYVKISRSFIYFAL